MFCKKPIEAGEMIIEYSGEKIRTSLTDRREKFYDDKVNCKFICLTSLSLLSLSCIKSTDHEIVPTEIVPTVIRINSSCVRLPF